MPAVIAPVLMRHKFTDGNSDPIIGGKLFTYIAGTNTPRATYTDESGNVANANPIILDANGECDLWLKPGFHKFVLKDANDNILRTIDRVTGYPSGSGSGGSGAISVVSSSQWYAPAGTGAIKAEENGVEVFKFSFEANQQIKRVFTVPDNYTGGPIYVNLPFYSPSTANAARFRITTALVNPGSAVSSTVNQTVNESTIQFSAPSDKLSVVPCYLSQDGKVNAVSILPKAKLLTTVERISTNPAQEGPDDIDDVRLIKDSDEAIYA